MFPCIERIVREVYKYYRARAMLKNTAPYFASTDMIFLEQVAVYENVRLNRLWTQRGKQKEGKFQTRKKCIVRSFMQFHAEVDYYAFYEKFMENKHDLFMSIRSKKFNGLRAAVSNLPYTMLAFSLFFNLSVF
jgi:hypothetical protein